MSEREKDRKEGEGKKGEVERDGLFVYRMLPNNKDASQSDAN